MISRTSPIIRVNRVFERLWAELQVGGETVSRARLVLHGVDVFPLRLNDIRSAGQAKRLGPKRDSPEDAFAAFGAMFSAVNPTVRPRASDRVCCRSKLRRSG